MALTLIYQQACLAGGEAFGVATGADLYLIKGVGHAQDSQGEWDNIWTADGLHDAFVHIADEVKNDKLQGKAVVSFSIGQSSASPLKEVSCSSG